MGKINDAIGVVLSFLSYGYSILNNIVLTYTRIQSREMDFEYLHNTEDKFYIEFSSPVVELGISETISFPGVENWNVSEVEYVKRVTPTYYIIECDDCVIRLEAEDYKVYVLIHNRNQTMELRKLIMHKVKSVTDIDNKYATGIKHIF